MPINRLLKVGKYTPAFDLALRSMGLVDRNDPLCEMVARKVIEAGAIGISDPKKIAEVAVVRMGLR